MNEELRLGELIYQEFIKNPKNKFMDNAKLICQDENKARRSYWAYVFLIKCGLKQYLEEYLMEHILSGYQTYKLLNYVILFKSEVLNEFDIQENFKTYFIDLFLKTYTLPERDLRFYIKDEMIRKTTIFKSLKEENDKLHRLLKTSVSETSEYKEKVDNLSSELARVNNELFKMMSNKEEIRVIKNTLLNYQGFLIVMTLGMIVLMILNFK